MSTSGRIVDVAANPELLDYQDPVASERRRKTAELWFRGISVRNIADVLGVEPATTRYDILVIRTELREMHKATILQYADELVERIRPAVKEAWNRIDDSETTVTAIPGLLNVILRAVETIGKVRGVMSPGKINEIDEMLKLMRLYDFVDRTPPPPEQVPMVSEIPQLHHGTYTEP